MQKIILLGKVVLSENYKISDENEFKFKHTGNWSSEIYLENKPVSFYHCSLFEPKNGIRLFWDGKSSFLVDNSTYNLKYFYVKLLSYNFQDNFSN